MGQRPFAPIQWLSNNSSNEELKGFSYISDDELPPPFFPEKKKSILPSFSPGENRKKARDSKSVEHFSPSEYFTPGWAEEGPSAKKAITLKQVIGLLSIDAEQQLLSQGKSFNRGLQQSIYHEFLLYSENKAIHCPELENIEMFWQHSKSSESPYSSELNQFIKAYCLRIVVLYFFKLRFAKVLSEVLNRPIGWKEIFNPTSFIFDIFKQSSSTSLDAKSLEANLFSWYRPAKHYDLEITKLAELADTISIGDLCKSIGPLLHQFGDPENATVYSHSLSHKHFGLFLNSLLINFPTWLQHQGNGVFQGKSFKGHEIISSKFCGDYLESMAQSHWLAQDNNKELEWGQILCSDFKGNAFYNGKFLKDCQEIQLMTFMASYASSHKKPVITFLSSIFKGHSCNKKNDLILQPEFMWDTLPEISSTYDRVVLHAGLLPKNNPHFHLVNQVINQEHSLKSEGLLYVLSNKGLFVPSQKDKVDQLLKIYKLEAQIVLEDVKGKGEVPSFIYIFSKKNAQQQTESLKTNKESCLSFRFHGDLTSFQNFYHITDQLNLFFEKYLKDHPPILQKEFNEVFGLEFHLDAIVDGRLIHSSNREANQITHPNYFKNLTRNCVPLDYFFDIKHIEKDHDQVSLYRENELLGLEMDDHFIYPYVLIIDQRRPQESLLEIIPAQAYKSKSYEMGFTQCQYFGLNPKRQGINPTLFRSFFASKMGKQLIEISLTGATNKYKSKVSSLFVPKFLNEPIEMPTPISQGLSILKLSSFDMLSMHPDELGKKVKSVIEVTNKLSTKYPFALLKEYTYFQNELAKAIDELRGEGAEKSINFSNPILKQSLIKLPTKPIFPENKDIYIKFHFTNKDDINSLFTSSQMNIGKEVSLDIYSRNNLMATIFAAWETLTFLHFILENAPQISLANLFQCIQIPEQSDLKPLVDNYLHLDKNLQELSDLSAQFIELLFSHNISLKPS